MVEQTQGTGAFVADLERVLADRVRVHLAKVVGYVAPPSTAGCRVDVGPMQGPLRIALLEPLLGPATCGSPRRSPTATVTGDFVRGSPSDGLTSKIVEDREAARGCN